MCSSVGSYGSGKGDCFLNYFSQLKCKNVEDTTDEKVKF